MGRKQLTWLLRVVVVVHVLLVLAQAAFAGNFTGGGGDGARGLHRLSATILIFPVALVQCILAVLAWRKKLQPSSFMVGSIILFVAEGAQIGFGFTGQMGLHVPLGTLIFGISLVLGLMTFHRMTPLPEEPV